jgi:hypothetical protein
MNISTNDRQRLEDAIQLILENDFRTISESEKETSLLTGE